MLLKVCWIALASLPLVDGTARAQAAVLRGDLKPATLDDPKAVPIAAETNVHAAPSGPRATVASVKVYELVRNLCGPVDKGRLPFKPAADKQPSLLPPAKAHTVTVAADGASCKLLLYCKNEIWYASSAATLKCSAGKEIIEFLDADLDGDCCGQNDFIRHNECAFRPLDEDRLVLLNDGFGKLEVDAKARPPRLLIRPLPWPLWSDQGQRSGIGIIGQCRQIAGLPLCGLDQDHSRICLLHANYLHANKYTFETPITKTHHEDPSMPGYTKEGADAANQVVFTFSGDMSEAVTAQVWAMFHREPFLGPGKSGIGIAQRVGSLVPGVPGYTVFWGHRPEIAKGGLPICFPAAGARDCATFCAREAPGVEDDPRFYETQRGLAVSVHYGDTPLAKIRFALFAEDKRKLQPVPGRLFSHERPISRSFDPQNSHAAFFVADQMLKTSTWYTAVFQAEVGGTAEALEITWSFQTQK